MIQPHLPCYVFYNDQLLVLKTPQNDGSNTYRIPLGSEISEQLASSHPIHQVNTADGKTIQTFAIEMGLTETEQWVMIGLRASYDYLSNEEYLAGGKAYQILYWDEHTRYCPVCGCATEQHTPIMKKCSGCGYELYPRINTAVIVLIRRGPDEILLVHARNFRGTFYGLVAGFLEPGETLEQCVAREVQEETGLTIKNIRYFASQPWPYPSGLMCGFTADYAGGTIKLQSDELSAGAFYHRDHLPEIPHKLSIARKLIDAWLERNIKY